MNLYQILGVDPTATQGEIKQAYRKLRSSAHPDKAGTAAQFHKLQHAYEVLFDPARREVYDATGKEQSAVRDPEAFITELLFKAINEISQPTAQNLVSFMKAPIQQGLELGERNKKKLQADIKKLQAVTKRLLRKGQESPAITNMLAAEIKKKEQAIVLVQQEIKFGRDVLKRLDEFEYKVDAYQPQIADYLAKAPSRWFI